MNRFHGFVLIILILFCGCMEEIALTEKTTSTIKTATTKTTITTTTTTSTTLEPVVAMMVRIRDFQARPQTVKIKKENAVTWMNEDPVAHNIAFDDFSSGPISQWQMYTQVFNETGTYHYYCSIHKRYMTGTVIVE